MSPHGIDPKQRDALDATGFSGLQVHGIAQGTGPCEARWKNLRLRELEP